MGKIIDVNNCYVGIYNDIVQISPDDWELRPITKIFTGDSTIEEILDWYEKGTKHRDISAIRLSKPK